MLLLSNILLSGFVKESVRRHLNGVIIGQYYGNEKGQTLGMVHTPMMREQHKPF